MLILTAVTFRFVCVFRGRRLGFLFGHFFLEELGEGQRGLVGNTMALNLSSNLSILCRHG